MDKRNMLVLLTEIMCCDGGTKLKTCKCNHIFIMCIIKHLATWLFVMLLQITSTKTKEIFDQA